MSSTRAETDAALAELETDLPQMIRESDAVYLMEEVEGLAGVILERAAPEDRAHVQARLQ